MSECYCAQIIDGVVSRVIVCEDDSWAAEHLGGEWLCTHERLVGIGWPVVNGEIVEPEPVDPPSSPIG
jgi:hypothetical protein